MTYTRAERYLRAAGTSATPEQFLALCMRLGRIHTGIRKICVNSGQAGRCRMDYLESILLSAGYRVGRWTHAESDGLRSRIRIDGKPIAHKQVSDLTEQIMNEIDGMRREAGADQMPEFDGEQRLCALALMAFCCHGCDFILFDIAEDCKKDPMWVASPFTLVMPCGFGTRDTVLAKKQATEICQAIRRGTREVITGFVGGEVYNLISQACAGAGSRLTVPAKSEAVISQSSLARTEFTYRTRGPYVMHSSYAVQMEAVLACIEACYALRRDGVRLPGPAMIAGVQRASAPVCFEVLTVRPGVIVNAAGTPEEYRAMLAALEEKKASFGGQVVLCTQVGRDSVQNAVSKAFSAESASFSLTEVICVKDKGDREVPDALTLKQAAKRILTYTDEQVTVLCVGDVAFAHGIREAVLDALNRLT